MGTVLFAACGDKQKETPLPTEAPQMTEAPEETATPVPTEKPKPTEKPTPTSSQKKYIHVVLMQNISTSLKILNAI